MLERILTGCDLLFRKFGIKSLSMDDIARELGMSKKTIYQYVSDKNDLVKKTFHHFLHCKQSRCLAIKSEQPNPVAAFVKITEEMSNQLKDINPSIFYDLKKYYPEAWELIKNFSSEFVYSQIKQNIEQGQQQGFYRKNIQPDTISRLYISMVHAITSHEFYNQTDLEFKTVYPQMIQYHFYGICTEKGLKQVQNND